MPSQPRPTKKKRPAPSAVMERLRAEEATLEARIAEARELPDPGAGLDDIHLVAEALVVDAAEKSFAANRLAGVRLAISAAERGAYGICEVCTQPIPPARLEIIPDATRCVPCASRRR